MVQFPANLAGADAGSVATWGVSAPAPEALTNVISVACGRQFDFGLSLLTDRTVRSWGRGDGGQTSVPAGLNNVTQLAGGLNYALALKADGRVVFWGNYWYGPFSIPSNLTNIIAIAAGWSHSLAVTREGTVIAWGWNANGQANVPVALSNVVAVAAGEKHSLALRSDGIVISWGANDQGQAGVPIDLANVAAIAAGATHSLALKSNGTVVAWGENTHGQASPPSGLSNVVAIAGGSFHSVALKADGTVANFGFEPSVPGLSNVTSIAAGTFSSYAVTLNPVFPWDGQPVATNIPAGGGLHMLARALSVGPVSWQWQFNGTNLPGATTDTLSVVGIQVAQQGSYRVLARNNHGVTASAASLANVFPSQPWIISQPEDSVVNQGTSVTLSMVVGGSEPLAFQWLRDGVPLAGATNATLTFPNLTTAEDGRYELVVMNELGTVTSTPVLLAVEPLAFATQPVSQTVAAGDDATFAVRAAGARPFEFQWRFFGVNLPHQTNSTLTLVNAQTSHAGAYDIVVRNATGTLTSAPVQLTVQATAPSIAIPPLGPVRREGELALLLTHVRGSEPLHYQWQLDGQNVSGATSQNLAIHRLQPSQAGSYRLVASNAVNVVTSTPVVVTVRPIEPCLPVAWGASVFGRTSMPDELTNVLHVAAAPAHNIAWTSDGELVGIGGLDIYPGGYPPGPSGLNNVAVVAAGSYFTVILHNDSSVSAWLPAYGDRPESFYAATGIIDIVAIAASPEHAVLLKRNGEVLRWRMQTDYSPPQPTGLSNIVAVASNFGKNIALRTDGTVLEWSDDAMETGEVLVVEEAGRIVAIAAGSAHAVGLRDDGKVTAWGWDGWGQTAVPPDLTDVVAVSAAEFGSIALKENGSVVMWGSLGTVSPEGDLPAALAGAQTIAGGFRHYVALTPVPLITNQPVSQTALIGGNAIFNVAARSPTPLRYQWQRDGIDIPGATNARLALNSVHLLDAGVYSVSVSNARYSVRSITAELVVNPFNLANVTFSTAAWGDYDNDGRQDLITDGANGTGASPPPQLFHNNGDGSFTTIPASLAEYSARGAWGDLDNDGWLDLVTAGISGVQIWRNRGDGTFTKLNAILSSDSGYSITTQDFDRDGSLDLALGSRLYRNLGNGTFTPVPLNLGSIEYVAGDWGDFDNDGWPDFLFSALVNGSAELKLLRNLGNGAFTNVNVGLPNIYRSDVAFGDLDGDGWLDVFLSGEVPGLWQPRSLVYRNLGNGMYSNMNANLPHVYGGHIGLADYDNDGRLDLFLGGNTSTNWLGAIFRNDGAGQFTKSSPMLTPPALFGAWGNYDNDGRLDLVYGGILSPTETSASLYRNKMPVVNSPPTSPDALRTVSGLNSITFQWNPASDTQTPTAALTYNVRMGSGTGAINILAPQSLPEGTRQLPAPGNAGTRTYLLLTNVSFGRYFWSVQTVDGAFAGSAFAPEQVMNYAAVTLPASDFTPTGVTLNGRMDTNRTPHSARFEWGQNSNYGNALVLTTNGSRVSAVLSGLTPGASYHFRLVVTNADGVAFGADESFRAPSAPEIVAVAAQVLGPNAAKLQVTANANGLPSIAYFDFGLDSTYGSRTPAAILNVLFSATSAQQTVSGLIGGSLHHYRVVVSNALGIATSPDLTFTTTPAPEAYTMPASNLSSLSAVLNGRFRANTLTTKVWFEHGQTTNYGLATTATDIGDGTNFVELPVFLGGLERLTPWHYRAVASNAFAIALGSDGVFTTLSDVITDPATGIGPTQAMLEGRANPEGLFTSVWFEHGLTTNYGAVTPTTAIGSGTNHVLVSAVLVGLERRTPYHCRLVAAKPPHTNFGNNVSFNTSNDVFTLPPTEVTQFSATLRGMLAPDGVENTAWFELSRSGGLTNLTPRFPVSAGANLVLMSQTVTGLIAAGNYSSRLWVSNTAGLRWGDAVTFVTPWVLSRAPTSFPGQPNGAVVPADFDHDGHMDLLSVGSNILQLIWNVAGTAAISTLPILGASPASADVGDFDNDTWLDILLAGTSSGIPSTRVLRNLGGTNFVPVTTSLAGISSGTARWGDYDHDGRLDILLAGQFTNGPATRLYRNLGTSGFVGITAALPALQEVAATWCDFNRDGHLDIAIAGRSGPSPFSVVCRLLRGNGRGAFTDANILLPGVRSGSIDWGDYNNDGWPDLLLTGFGSIPISPIRLLRNNGGTSFVDATGSLPQFSADAVRWGDFDSDGWPDILVQGQKTLPTTVPTTSASALLRNSQNGVFEEIRFPLPEVTLSSGGWADFNGDGRLDVVMSGNSRTGAVSLLYLNNMLASNTPPGLASSLIAAVSNHTARLSWVAASDLQTPPSGLTYGARVKRLPNGPEVIAPVAGTNGIRRVVQAGANGPLTFLQLEGLAPGRYMWSVQAVDSAFAGSAFASEAMFDVVAPIFHKISALPDGQLVLRFSGLPTMTYQLESSTNLTQWSLGGLLGPLTNDFFEAIQPASTSLQQYFRLKLRE
jgi:alpha-tubulin suppressor-like RCC1 family protein